MLSKAAVRAHNFEEKEKKNWISVSKTNFSSLSIFSQKEIHFENSYFPGENAKTCLFIHIYFFVDDVIVIVVVKTALIFFLF